MGSRILVVEDVRSSREIVAQHLRRGGHDVLEAEDGEQGLAAARAQAPDLVLTDLEMPRLDGLGFLQALQQEQPDCPAIVLSAHEDLTHILGAIRQGIVFDYLIKPVEETLLGVAVHRALEVCTLRAKVREMDQVLAMRQLAMTAGDQILNPLNVITFVVHVLRTQPTPENIRVAVHKLEKMTERISRAITRMSQISRYTPEWVAGNLWQIDLEAATAPLGDAGGPLPLSSLAPPPARPVPSAQTVMQSAAPIIATVSTNVLMPQSEASGIAPQGDLASMLDALVQWAGDRDVLQTVLPIFLEEAPGFLTALRASIAAGNGDAVREVAHSLRGSLPNVGPALADVRAVAAALERAGSTQDLADAARLCSHLEAGLNDLYHRIRWILAELARGGGQGR